MCFHMLSPLLFFKFLVCLPHCTVSSLAVILLTRRPLGLAGILVRNGLVVYHCWINKWIKLQMLYSLFNCKTDLVKIHWLKSSFMISNSLFDRKTFLRSLLLLKSSFIYPDCEILYTLSFWKAFVTGTSDRYIWIITGNKIYCRLRVRREHLTHERLSRLLHV